MNIGLTSVRLNPVFSIHFSALIKMKWLSIQDICRYLKLFAATCSKMYFWWLKLSWAKLMQHDQTKSNFSYFLQVFPVHIVQCACSKWHKSIPGDQCSWTYVFKQLRSILDFMGNLNCIERSLKKKKRQLYSLKY